MARYLPVESRRKHGTYRPNLAKLVSGNSVKDIRETTKKAFAEYAADNSDFAKSITLLSKLKGIGPATASLFLSCYDSVKVPFFSDELYRYLHWSDAKSKGWDRKISYTMKEYKDLWQKLQDMRERVEKESGHVVEAIEVEKMAYVLAKEAVTTKHNINDDSDDQALRPPSPKRRRKATPPLSMNPVEICRRKGPRGSPTYDEMGYELDYDYINKVSYVRRRPSYKKLEKMMEKETKEKQRKEEIMGFPLDKTNMWEVAWDDRVARDLGIAYHEVGIEEYEEWHKRGFHADRADFEKISEEEKARLMKVMTGSALRKGSKRR